MLSKASAGADLSGLATRSPFMPAAGAGLAGQTAEPAGALEFRGIAVEREGTFFSVFDASANRGYWLREGMVDGAIHVARYDAESSTLEIEQNGRAVKLSLKQASTASSAKPILTATAPVFGVPRRSLRTQPTATADQSKRLAQIAKEVRDRRALRMAAQAVPGRPAATSTSPGL